MLELSGRKTVSVTDIIFILNRVCRTYGAGLMRLLMWNSKEDSCMGSILRLWGVVTESCELMLELGLYYTVTMADTWKEQPRWD